MNCTVDENPEGYDNAMLLGDHTYYGDMLTDLVAVVLGNEDYPELDDDDATYERYLYMVKVANAMTAAANEANFEWFESLDELDFNAVMLSRDEVADLGLSEWNHDVPLHLVSLDFRPSTDVVPPTGNVLMLNPYDEATFLRTLDALGLVELFLR